MSGTVIKVKNAHRKTDSKRFIVYLSFSVLFFIITLEMCSRYYYERYYLKEINTSNKPIILMIGDSFLASEVSFPFVLGKKLKGRYKVINAAEVGIGPNHYLMNMSLNLRKKPQICIVSFYLGNDIIDLRGFELNPQIERLKLFLGKHLYSYHVVRTIWARIMYHVPDKEQKKALEKGVRNAHLFRAGKNQPRIVIRNLTVEDDDIISAWNTLSLLVAQMKELAQRYEVPLYAVLIPDCIQVSVDYQSVYKNAGFEMKVATNQMVKPQELITRILIENQIPYLDLLPEFKKMNGLDIYFKDDPHMTPKGHSIVAEILLGKLNNSNLLR